MASNATFPPSTATTTAVPDATLSQEIVCVAVVAGVGAAVLSLALCVWLIRCRRTRAQNDEERAQNQRDKDHYHDKKQSTPFNRRKVHDKQNSVKKADVGKAKKLDDINSPTGGRHSPLPQKMNSNETIAEFESRIRDQFSPANVLEEIKEEREAASPPAHIPANNGQSSASTAAGVDDSSGTTPGSTKKNKTISELAASTGTLQRNDSKVNVFNLTATNFDEVDLNPGLQNTINLSTI